MIEPEDTVRADLCAWLREIGFEAIGENNGHSGLSRIVLRERTSRPIDGIVMSMNLKLLESQTVLEELLQTNPAIPILLLGERRQRAKMEELISLGASACMEVPIDPDLFKVKILAFFTVPDQPDS